MTTAFSIILVVLAALLAWGFTFISSKSRISKLEAEHIRRESELQSELAISQAALKAEQEHQQTAEQQLKTLKDQLTIETEKILKAREEELSKGNRSTMDEILKPLKDSMDKMEKAMQDNAKEHLTTTTDLKAKLEQAVKDMSEKTSAVGAKADSLSEALTGRPKVQGCWGENYLDDILANEGLTNGLQYTREDAREDRSRPDFIFHFKEGLEQKDLVVDSKVSLTAFVEYVNADDEQSREEALKRHLASVRKHISELAAKEYAKKVDQGRRFADYVLMFMPIDSAYRVAAAEDPMLWSDAYSKGVLIATEQTIMPFLKIMQLTWNKYQQDTNILKVTKAAEDMIERVGQIYSIRSLY